MVERRISHAPGLFQNSVAGRFNLSCGFTLIELLIVLVVISIVASIATMSALSARVQANESQAKMALKAISTGAEIYRNTQGTYADGLETMGSDYLSPDLASGQKSGYSFEFTAGSGGVTFTCTAVPVNQYHTGVKSYCISTLNAIYVYDSAPSLTADGTDCPSGGSALSA